MTSQVSKELGISQDIVESVYKSYWKFIRSTISSIPLEELEEDGFDNITTNFNIPYIGKLHTSYNKVQRVKRKIKYAENHVKIKRNKTNVQSSSCD